MEAKLNLKPLENIIKAMRPDAIPKIYVGIGSSNVARSGGSSDNLTIGTAHEFGTSSIPKRSFLREPLSIQFSKKLDSSNQFSKKSVEEIAQKQTLKPWFDKIAGIALGTVHEGFATQGFGKWPPDKVQDHQTLVDTGQLRDSIVAVVI